MNEGKRFESNFKSSINKDHVFYHRLKDSTGNFSGGNKLRFSTNNPCDCFLYDDNTRTFYALELKSTKGKSISFEYRDVKKPSAMIHKHQIESLEEIGRYNVVSGFVFNFREYEKTYFQEIDDFIIMIGELNKSSFNMTDIIKYNPIIIEETRLKVNSRYDIEKFLSDTRL